MAPALNARLATRNLRVIRGGHTVLDVPEFDLTAGEVTALIGPNGAGKSTLLLHLALLERLPRGADVLFDGVTARGRELALRRRMAVAFQEPLLLDRSVRANVEAGLRMRGVPGAARRERSTRWLERFGVAHLAGRSSRTLSGGEAQRVSLARAFALEPEVLLLDEPFSALDQPTREALTSDLASALSETGVTALVVTHDRNEAARLGHRIAVLIDGRIRQVGTPSEVLGEPVDSETAAFVGVESMFAARVVNRADGLVMLEAAGHHLEAIDSGEFMEALVCLRPEDVSLSEAAERAASSVRNHMSGRVARVIVSGGDARVEIDCGVRLVARVTRRSLEEMGIAEGATVTAAFKATAVHLIPR